MGHAGLPKMPGYKSVPVTEVWEGGGSVEAGEKHYMQPPPQTHIWAPALTS